MKIHLFGTVSGRSVKFFDPELQRSVISVTRPTAYREAPAERHIGNYGPTAYREAPAERHIGNYGPTAYREAPAERHMRAIMVVYMMTSLAGRMADTLEIATNLREQ